MKSTGLNPWNIIPWLLGAAIGVAGLLQGLHWRNQTSAGAIDAIQSQLRMVTEENEILHRENEALRSLAQGGGEMSVPQEFIDMVENEFELKFLANPVVHRIAIEELRDRIGASIESKFGPSGIDDRQEAYRLIGWLGAGDDLLAQLTAVRAVGARSWFDELTGDGWVTDRFEISNIPDQAALVRLLANQLLHQHFPPPPSYPGDDAARAREALIHGAASGAEHRYLTKQARTIGFLQMDQNTEVEQLMTRISPFIQGVALFPALAGRGLADTIYIEGTDALHRALRNPPQTTRAILFPAETTHSHQKVQPPVSDEPPYLVESAGQLGLRLWLELSGDVGFALELSNAWRGDGYVLVADGGDDSSLLWDIEMATEQDAGKLLAYALDYLAELSSVPDSSVQVGQEIQTNDGRYLRVDRPRGTRVRFTNRIQPTSP